MRRCDRSVSEEEAEVGETLEKKLRVALEAKIPFGQLRRTIFGVDIEPGAGKINLIVGNLRPALVGVVEQTLRSLLPDGYREARVIRAEEAPSAHPQSSGTVRRRRLQLHVRRDGPLHAQHDATRWLDQAQPAWARIHSHREIANAWIGQRYLAMDPL